MLSRDWILETLAQLPVYYWPVFFWDLWWFERYYQAYRAATRVGMIGIGVTRTGRIIITLQVAGDRGRPDDWRALAPREPWLRLAPRAGFAAPGQGMALDCFCTAAVPLLDYAWTAAAPARPLAPP